MQPLNLIDCHVTKTNMYRLFLCLLFVTVSLGSCVKSNPALVINPIPVVNPSSIIQFGGLNGAKSDTVQSGYELVYDGQWKWIGTIRGIYFPDPITDSPIVLRLAADNTYSVTLNGQLSMQGTYSTDSSTFWNNIIFNNIIQPAGDTISVTTGNITRLYFNYSQIGGLTIFRNNEISVSGDTLTLLRTPITPETPVSLFIRIGN
jgi:hypothetical protein